MHSLNHDLGIEDNPPEYEAMTAKLQRERREKKEQQDQERQQELHDAIEAKEKDGKERRNTADDTQDGRKDGRSSKWIEHIRKEQLAKEQKEAQAKRERAERYKMFLDSDSEDEDNNYKNLQGDKLQEYLTGINRHLKAEQAVIDAWDYKDKKKKQQQKA